jgi:hypothetical protein
MSVCKLRHRDVRRWNETGDFPNCLHHHHCSRTEAETMVKSNDAFPVTGKSAIVLFDSNFYQWAKVVDQTGIAVLQMVPVMRRG